jgi:hypothetical protein
MNYNDKKSNNELDDMNIKSHLNASLDLSGINVSEDLINRTLAAMGQQQSEQTDREETAEHRRKKVIPWNRYLRTAAGIAAAVVVVVLGYQAVSQMHIGVGSKEKSFDSSTAEDSSDNSIMMEETAQGSESAGLADKNAATAEGSAEIAAADTAAQDQAVTAPQYTITASDELTTSDAGDDANGSTTGSSAGDTQESAEAESKADESSAADSRALTKNTESLTGSRTAFLTFRDIYLPDPAQAEYIKISDELNQIEITLTKQEDILEFYSVMDQHQFTYNSNGSTGENYKVEVKSPEPDKAFYTMAIGDTVQVIYEAGETVSQSCYNASDMVLLKQNLDEFIKKYNQ